jgi:hypothetical protein
MDAGRPSTVPLYGFCPMTGVDSWRSAGAQRIRNSASVADRSHARGFDRGFAYSAKFSRMSSGNDPREKFHRRNFFAAKIRDLFCGARGAL